jgi:hypothetical protein
MLGFDTITAYDGMSALERLEEAQFSTCICPPVRI